MLAAYYLMYAVYWALVRLVFISSVANVAVKMARVRELELENAVLKKVYIKESLMPIFLGSHHKKVVMSIS